MTGEKPRFTREAYLTLRVMMAGSSPFVARQAVASTALAHPEWDMGEQRTWDEWEAEQ